MYANGYTDVILVRNSLYDEFVKENNYFYDAHLMPEQYEDALKKWYENRTGQNLDFNNLTTYNEKIQWMKLYGKLEQYTNLTDKIQVRRFIRDRIGEKYLTKLFGVWDTFSDIPFSQLPLRFMLNLFCLLYK